jgi:hypothetical protein
MAGLKRRSSRLRLQNSLANQVEETSLEKLIYLLRINIKVYRELWHSITALSVSSFIIISSLVCISAPIASSIKETHPEAIIQNMS